MNNLGAIITTVALVIAGIYLLSLGDTVRVFIVRLFWIPDWGDAPAIVGMAIRAIYLVVFVVVIRYILLGVRRND